MSQNPLVSVIIAVYNTEDYLEECLDSLLNQTLENIEIICINDASTDSSLEILENYAKKDNRITIINNEKSSGPSITRNKGLKIAKGEYITFCDSDDKVELDAYERLYDFAKAHDNDVVCFNAVRFNYTGVEWQSVLHAKSITGETFIQTNMLKNPELIYDTILCNKFINKKYFDEHGFKFVEDRLYEDILFTMEVFTNSNSIGICPKVKYYWRVRNDIKRSITQSVDNVKNLNDRIFITKRIIELFKSSGYGELIELLYVKLVEIDILQFINEFDIGNDEFKEIMFSEIKHFVEKLPKTSFNTISDLDKLKYDLFLNEDIDTLVTILHQQRLDITKQKKSNIKIVELSNKVKKYKKDNKKLKSENKELLSENKKLKDDLDYLKSGSGWSKFKVKKLIGR